MELRWIESSQTRPFRVVPPDALARWAISMDRPAQSRSSTSRPRTSSGNEKYGIRPCGSDPAVSKSFRFESSTFKNNRPLEPTRANIVPLSNLPNPPNIFLPETLPNGANRRTKSSAMSVDFSVRRSPFLPILFHLGQPICANAPSLLGRLLFQKLPAYSDKPLGIIRYKPNPGWPALAVQTRVTGKGSPVVVIGRQGFHRVTEEINRRRLWPYGD